MVPVRGALTQVSNFESSLGKAEALASILVIFLWLATCRALRLPVGDLGVDTYGIQHVYVLQRLVGFPIVEGHSPKQYEPPRGGSI